MNGHVIPGTCIAVDFWKIRGVQGQLIHFLTHLHGDHIVGLTSSWASPIYCSEFTAQLLHAHHGVQKPLLKILHLEQSTLISISNASESFCVTAYEANHCPGALMLYFEGTFGNIFYTGDFRFSTNMKDHLHHLTGKIDKLYLDNTFCSPDCVFPSREECQQKILEIIKDHPDSNVIIGIRKLGKESMLASLAVELNETIFVSPERYHISQCLFDSNVFAVAPKEQKARLRTQPLHSVTRERMYQKNQIAPTIAILPTAIFTGLGCKPFSRDPNIYVVPYSDHSCYPELVEFVRLLQPKHIIPIVTKQKGPFGKDISDRLNMSILMSHMKSDKTSSLSLHSDSAVFKDNDDESMKECDVVRTKDASVGSVFKGSEDKSTKECNVVKIKAGSVSEQTNGKKFVCLKPKLSSCDNVFTPTPPLKRKMSHPDKRKKKIAKGVTFEEDVIESKSDCDKVSKDNSKASSLEAEDQNCTLSPFICQRNETEVEQPARESETASCTTNGNLDEHLNINKSSREENVQLDRDKPSQHSNVSKTTTTNFASIHENTLPDSDTLDKNVIENSACLDSELNKSSSVIFNKCVESSCSSQQPETSQPCWISKIVSSPNDSSKSNQHSDTGNLTPEQKNNTEGKSLRGLPSLVLQSNSNENEKCSFEDSARIDSLPGTDVSFEESACNVGVSEYAVIDSSHDIDTNEGRVPDSVSFDAMVVENLDGSGDQSVSGMVNYDKVVDGNDSCDKALEKNSNSDRDSCGFGHLDPLGFEVVVEPSQKSDVLKTAINLVNTFEEVMPGFDSFDKNVIENLACLVDGDHDSSSGEMVKCSETSFSSVFPSFAPTDVLKSSRVSENVSIPNDNLLSKEHFDMENPTPQQQKSEEQACITSQIEVLQSNIDENVPCNFKGITKADSLQQHEVDEEKVPDSMSNDAISVVNQVALEGSGEDSASGRVNVNKEVVDGENSRDQQELLKSEAIINGDCILRGVRQSVSPRFACHDLNTEKFPIQSDEMECSQLSTSNHNRGKVHRLGKFVKKQCSHKLSKNSGAFGSQRSKGGCSFRLQKSSVKRLLQAGVKKLSKFNNEEEFRKALAKLM